MRLLSAFILILGFAFVADAAPRVCTARSTVMGGDTRPWPFGHEMTFPWTEIQGVWSLADDTGCSSYFVVKPRMITSKGMRSVEITQYDPVTCKQVAWGVGIESENILTARMISTKGRFDLTLRAFDLGTLMQTQGMRSTEYSNGQSLLDMDDAVIVMSVFPRGKWDQRRNFRLRKEATAPLRMCQ